MKAATNTHTTEELLEVVFPVPSRVRLYNVDQMPLLVCEESLQADSQLRFAAVRSEKPVTEAGDSLGTQRKGNLHCWKMLPNKAVKTLTEKTSLCVIVICRSWSRVV
jgi:hypothetical protein